MIKLKAIITGNSSSDVLKEIYLASREFIKGMRIPPRGMANLMTPIAVPEILPYNYKITCYVYRD